MMDSHNLLEGLWAKPGLRGGDTCVDGTGVPTWVLLDGFLAGDSVKSLAENFGVSPQSVEIAIRWEVTRKLNHLEEE